MSEFSVDFTVRDYELDMQGIVNNSVYQNYLEHARHEYLHFHGIDFANLTERGVILVVKHISMDFKNSLKSKDQFKVLCYGSQWGCPDGLRSNLSFVDPGLEWRLS